MYIIVSLWRVTFAIAELPRTSPVRLVAYASLFLMNQALVFVRNAFPYQRVLTTE